MGEVIVVYKIMPDPEKFDSVKKGLQRLRPERVEEEPIAFGIKALKVTMAMPDSGGVQDEIEEKLRKIDGVNSMELVTFSRAI
jgi:elongation factor 1-beta